MLELLKSNVKTNVNKYTLLLRLVNRDIRRRVLSTLKKLKLKKLDKGLAIVYKTKVKLDEKEQEIETPLLQVKIE